MPKETARDPEARSGEVDATRELVDIIRDQQANASAEKRSLIRLFGLLLGGLFLLFAGVLGISMKLDFFGVFGGSTDGGRPTVLSADEVPADGDVDVVEGDVAPIPVSVPDAGVPVPQPVAVPDPLPEDIPPFEYPDTGFGEFEEVEAPMEGHPLLRPSPFLFQHRPQEGDDGGDSGP